MNHQLLLPRPRNVDEPLLLLKIPDSSFIEPPLPEFPEEVALPKMNHQLHLCRQKGLFLSMNHHFTCLT